MNTANIFLRQGFLWLMCTLLLISCSSLHAQKREMKGKNLAAYVGTWQYATATDTFTLVLKEVKRISDVSNMDCLYGVHYYKKNGVIIDNYLGSTPTQSNWTFEASNARYQEFQDRIDPYSLGAIYIDNNKQDDEWMDGRFDLNPNNPKEMTWTLTEKEGEVLYLGEEPPPQDMSSTIPKIMILKKIK